VGVPFNGIPSESVKAPVLQGLLLALTPNSFGSDGLFFIDLFFKMI